MTDVSVSRLFIALTDKLLTILSVSYDQATTTTTTTTTTTSSTLTLTNYSNTSIPTDADNTSALDVSMATMTSPCEGCDHLLTTFNVSDSPVYHYKSQSSLSTGKIQSSLTTGDTLQRCAIRQ